MDIGLNMITLICQQWIMNDYYVNICIFNIFKKLNCLSISFISLSFSFMVTWVMSTR